MYFAQHAYSRMPKGYCIGVMALSFVVFSGVSIGRKARIRQKVKSGQNQCPRIPMGYWTVVKQPQGCPIYKGTFLLSWSVACKSHSCNSAMKSCPQDPRFRHPQRILPTPKRFKDRLKCADFEKNGRFLASATIPAKIAYTMVRVLSRTKSSVTSKQRQIKLHFC